ncbi:Nuclear cap-binding protein subunit 1 [Coemansia pectinata]|uniref:Nuclear cap-binding protein subunit 1 n=1 Tax=Coemansia pectinata TaxID=1052879 RepID=A0A9W8L644_9FUNG|nr:Nuclear cap-binding protein subunit 1 [Coemansia pectinata]
MLFDNGHVGSWSKFHYWEILHNTVKKVNMRVVQLQGRLEAANTAANAMADDDVSVAAENQTAESVEHVEATLAQMVQEQKDVVVSTTRHFARLLSSDLGAAGELDRAWLHGRFKEFLRTYRVQIMENAPVLESEVFTAEASSDVRQAFEDVRKLSA